MLHQAYPRKVVRDFVSLMVLESRLKKYRLQIGKKVSTPYGSGSIIKVDDSVSILLSFAGVDSDRSLLCKQIVPGLDGALYEIFEDRNSNSLDLHLLSMNVADVIDAPMRTCKESPNHLYSEFDDNYDYEEYSHYCGIVMGEKRTQKGWDILANIAKTKGATKCQILIRWAIEKGYNCVPRSGVGSKLEKFVILENSLKAS